MLTDEEKSAAVLCRDLEPKHVITREEVSIVVSSANRLARLALRDHPPDDDTLLDAEFLRGLGWAVIWDGAYRIRRDDNIILTLFHDSGLFVSLDDNSIEWPVKLRTRGQLRDLLAVLGEGKEGG